MKLQQREQDGMDLGGEFAGGRDDDGGDMVFLSGLFETEEFLD